MKKSYDEFKGKCDFRSLIALCMLLTMMLSGNLVVFGQSDPVSGNITARSGKPIAGATIIIKGTGAGAVSDSQGKFSIPSGAGPGAVLSVSLPGYVTQSAEIGGRRVVDVVLEEDATLMDELIVVGYGTMKKKDLTGALSSVEGSDVAKRQTEQISTALQGAMPGVTVTRTNSAPGGGATIRIRGITSMTSGASDPYVLIDGVPGSLSDVNPNDLENITVLRDAASSSIYGSQAAAGVILVTTKRGGKQGVGVDYNYSLGIDIPTAMPDYMDAVGYMKGYNEQAYNDNPAEGWYQVYSKDRVDNYWALNSHDSDLFPNTKWVPLVMNNHALRHSHSLGITSGSERRSTKISVGFDDVDGLFRKNLAWKRYTIRTNNDLQLFKWLNTSADLSARYIDKINPYFSPSANMRWVAPIYPAVWSDGRLAPGKDGENLYARFMEGGTQKEDSWQTNAKLQFDITPVKGLVISGIFAPRFNYTKSKDFKKAVTYFDLNDEATVSNKYIANATSNDLTETRNENFSHTTQFFANYSEVFGNNHNFSAMAGYENYWYQSESINAAKEHYPHALIPYLSAGGTEFVTAGSGIGQTARRSVFGRVMYNYKSKYYIQANLRYDGSSRFGNDYRWGLFPSASAGWVISEERFMEPVRRVISFAKFRVSYGQLGNERIGNYPYQDVLSTGYPVGYVSGEVTPLTAYYQGKAVFADLTWESTATYDIGLDVNLFRDKLIVAADWYYKKTSDMLLDIPIPSYLGLSDPTGNVGIMYTKGWEFTVGWRDRIGELFYSVSFNLSDYKTKMGYIGDKQIISNGTIIQEGLEYQTWWGYMSDGLYQNEGELDGAVKTGSTVTVGDIRYRNIDDARTYNEITGQWEVADSDRMINTEYDRVALGGSLPRFNYGANIGLEWRGIDFNMTFQGVGKKLSYLSEQMVSASGQWYNLPADLEGNSWSMKNTIEQNLNARYPRYSKNSSTNNYAYSDFWLINGAYLRIKNITVGYTLPVRWTNKFAAQSLRLSVSLTDFFTFSHFPKGWDPEGNATAYPITKSALISASLKF